MRLAATLAAAATVLGLGAPLRAAGRDVPHPFLLWTREEAAALRRKVETEPWARAVCEKMPAAGEGRSLARLFQYVVLGDAAAGEAEKKDLLACVRSPVPLGGAQEFTVLRYDVLYDALSPAEREAVESAFRKYLDYSIFTNGVLDPALFNDERKYSRYDARRYTRANWLPNIIWPRKVSGNLMALVLRDADLARRSWGAYGSWQWYFDEYLCDTGFYAEEFSKMGSTPGAMLLYALGARRLGLDGLGFGYRGRGGATLRGHIESLLHLGYPRVDIGSSRPHYPMVTIGDLRQSGSSQRDRFGGEAFQHSIVRGYLADGTGGNERWMPHGAWGGTRRGRSPQWDLDKTEKMQVPLWFEVAHREWRDAGFDYFLARMREPGEDRYVPTLFFGLDPIDPAGARPPPAPSAVWPQRGLVMLRAEEGPAYWESEAPAACLRLAADYAHNVHDAFALAGYYAFNRPIYLNRQITPGYAQGWCRSVLSHAGVLVDLAEPRFTGAVAVRHAFTPAAKFVAARSAEVYPGVDLERALVLTREYLLDVTRVAGDRPHACHWLVHTLGEQRTDEAKAWERSEDLGRSLYGAVGDRGRITIRDERRLAPGERTWSLTALQTYALDDLARSRVGAAWYGKRVGVRLTMLGEAGTAAYVHRTPDPLPAARPGAPPPPPEPNEFGGVTVVAAREAPRTTFAVLHEPFQGGTARIPEFRRLAETPEGLAVAVGGDARSAVQDRVLLRLGDGADRPLTLAGDGETFTFTGWGLVRVGPAEVQAWGGVQAMRVKVGGGRPRLVLNGKDHPATVEAGSLVMSSP